MKKILAILLCAVMVASLAACGGTASSSQPASESAAAATLTGTGKGFGGPVTVTVTMEGDKIVAVEAVGEKETNGIGTNALEQLPAKIVEANSPDVDVVSGATVTSEAIIYAVKNAMDPAAYPAPEEEAAETSHDSGNSPLRRSVSEIRSTGRPITLFTDPSIRSMSSGACSCAA